MVGTYDVVLVVLSYLIASLAGFVALEFATRLRVRTQGRWPWLVGGAIAMGTGIWSMHFVGMTAFSLPVPITYDIGITFLSWAAAVAVCAIALYIVGYGRLTGASLAAGAIVMGAGVCLMHYSGMWAMRMTPGITYHPGLFALSVAIAVAASGAALVIIAYLKEMRTWRDFALRVGAALVMGFAVVGMHYTGMAAAQFADGAYCFSGNALSAAALPWPTTIATLVILGCGIAFALGDARELAAARRSRRESNARVVQMAFVDRETGLANRARLSQVIIERVREQPAHGFSLVTFRLEGRDDTTSTSGGLMCALRDRLQTSLPDAFLARTTPEHIVAIVDGRFDRAVELCTPLVDALRRDPVLNARHRLMVGSAHCPTDGESAHWLLLRATPKTDSGSSAAVA
jgi:NO-binding membrane sensor protein with MHYT domain/GGDEF domain-containing protein